MKIYLRGKLIPTDPSKSIGKGGEADIYDIGSGLVLKVFKQPDHADFIGFPYEQEMARERLKEHQRKLPAFPKNLPSHVIIPIDLATDSKKNIVGYSMTYLKNYDMLLKYSDRKFRQAGVDNELVIKTFLNLHGTLKGIHKAGVVIGDFNDLNVMVGGGEAYIIDADSFQFGPYRCTVFTEKFVDPMLCDPSECRPILIQPHNEHSDWYAFAALLLQSLLFVGPYGGVYKPKDKNVRIVHAQRPLKRITIFDPEVKYPKPAIHYGTLPDDMLQRFHQIFREDKREEFPIGLLEHIRWTSCSNCGTIHARTVCPGCATHVPAAVKETIRGNVTCTRIFQTAGMMLAADIQGDKLRYLYYNNGEFRRENDSLVVKGNLKPTMRFRLRGSKETLIGDKDQFIAFTPGGKPEKTIVDSFNSLPLFDTNSYWKYWVYDGQLLRSDTLGPKYIGDVLKNQTLFWVGPQFGFGFYRAGGLNSGFVFDAHSGGLNDRVDIPVIKGQLIDATCYFAGNWVWFLVSYRDRGQTINRCVLVTANGDIRQMDETRSGDGSWLGTIRGKCAAGNFMLAATDNGIVRIEPTGGTLAITKEFPDTEPFVDSGCHIYPSKNGLYVVSRKEIKLLKIS